MHGQQMVEQHIHNHPAEFPLGRIQLSAQAHYQCMSISKFIDESVQGNAFLHSIRIGMAAHGPDSIANVIAEQNVIVVA